MDTAGYLAANCALVDHIAGAQLTRMDLQVHAQRQTLMEATVAAVLTGADCNGTLHLARARVLARLVVT